MFKLATNMKSGGAGADLIQGKLEKLAEKKKDMEKELKVVSKSEENRSLVSTAKTVIKSNIIALKAAMKKGKPHFQKRLFGNLFQQLLVTENGIEVFYELETESKNVKPSDSKSDGNSLPTKWFYKQTLEFLADLGSPVVTFGGGGGSHSQPLKSR